MQDARCKMLGAGAKCKVQKSLSTFSILPSLKQDCQSLSDYLPVFQVLFSFVGIWELSF